MLRHAPPRHNWWLVLILVVAGVMRLSYALLLPGQGRDLLHSDMGVYDLTGWQMARQEPLPNEPVLGYNGYHPLSASTLYYAGYTYFVAAIYWLFGHHPFVVRIVQALLSTATVWLVYRIGAATFSQRAGLVAAALTAVHLPLVYYAGLLVTETWFLFLQLATLAAWQRAWDAQGAPVDHTGSQSVGRARRRAGRNACLCLALLAGLFAGLACITRTVFLSTVAVLGLAAVVFPPTAATWSRRFAFAALFWLAAAVVVAPVAVRNYQIHNRLILVTTNGPITFMARVQRMMPDPKRVPDHATDATISDRYRSQGLEYLRRDWREYLDEVPEHFYRIWFGRGYWPEATPYWMFTRLPFDPENPRRQTMVVHEATAPPFPRASYFPDLANYADTVTWLLIGLPFGLLAVFLLPRGNRHWVCLLPALTPYIITPFLAPPYPRYRVPAVPLFFILAGHTLTILVQIRQHWSARDDSEHTNAKRHVATAARATSRSSS
jgi:4-amino-4-deoxy-L-arabinose transferase-like glycosyltransferase